MQFVRNSNSIRFAALSALFVFVSQTAFADHHEHTSGPFAGAKVNGGAVTHTKSGNNNILTLSDDFKVPDTPDPHWRVVDYQGNVYDLQKLSIKGGWRIHRALCDVCGWRLSNARVPRQRQYHGLNHLHDLTASTCRRARVFDSDRFRSHFVKRVIALACRVVR